MGKRKFNIDSNYVIKSYLSGTLVKDIACKFGCSEHVIRIILYKAGIDTSRKSLTDNLSVDKVLELYNQGIGIAGIAKRLGYGRTAMIAFFKKHNIPQRNPHEQQVERMRHSTPEQIAHLTEAAHKATKGRKPTFQSLEEAAFTRFLFAFGTESVYESVFISILKSFGINYAFQFPVGTYNIDFVVNGIAVEIFGGTWHRSGEHRRRFAKRTKYILDEGFPMIFVFAYDVESFKAVITDYVIPYIQEMSADKSFVGQYRVIWRNGKCVTTGSSDTIEQALVSPFIHFRNPANGRYESVTSNTTSMLRQ